MSLIFTGNRSSSQFDSDVLETIPVSGVSSFRLFDADEPLAGARWIIRATKFRRVRGGTFRARKKRAETTGSLEVQPVPSSSIMLHAIQELV